MKLTVVPPDRIDSIVPQISRCANTQNKVQDADFSANDPWHIRIEQISRTLWTGATPEAVRGTRWFYERSHGQYADELGRCATAAAKKTFRTENPPTQKITKTDAAKYLLGWEQHPAHVAKGAQKAFTTFMQTSSQDWPETGAVPDALTFKRIVALAILHKGIERLYAEMGFQGYRSQVVTYSVARLSMAMTKAIDADAFWRKQEVPSELLSALKLIVEAVRDVILNAPASHKNISEWCKKDACWTAVSRINCDVKALKRSRKATECEADSGAPEIVVAGSEDTVEAIQMVTQSAWFALSSWAKQTGSLLPWQRAIAYTLGGLAARRKAPSLKHAVQGRALLLSALEAGYTHSDLPPKIVQQLKVSDTHA